MVLITGGRGYLGQRISEHLHQNNIEFRIGSRKKDNKFISMDFTNEKSLDIACKGVTSIIHLASINAKESEVNPKLANTINSLGTLKLIKAAERNNINKIIYFSTAHVYSSPLFGAIDEETNTLNTHPYAKSHLDAEKYVGDAFKRSIITGLVFRLTNAVGYPVTKEPNCWMLIANDLCKQAAESKSMEVFSNKSIQRDFLPISAICSATLYAIKNDDYDGQVLNLSAGNCLSLEQLTNLIAERANKILGIRPKITFKNKNTLSKNKPLIISNKKLLESGLNFNTSLNNEIDELLLRCQKWFNYRV